MVLCDREHDLFYLNGIAGQTGLLRCGWKCNLKLLDTKESWSRAYQKVSVVGGWRPTVVLGTSNSLESSTLERQAWEAEVAALFGTRLVVAVYVVPGQTKLYSETLKRVDALKLMLGIDFFF